MLLRFEASNFRRVNVIPNEGVVLVERVIAYCVIPLKYARAEKFVKQRNYHLLSLRLFAEANGIKADVWPRMSVLLQRS